MQPILSLSSLPRRLTTRLSPLTIPTPQSSKRTISTSQSSPKTLILRHTTLAEVERILGYRFRNRSLLVEAMTHRSVIRKGKGRGFLRYETPNGGLKEVKADYERLECVGDRVLGLVVVQALYERKKKASEGNITTQFHTLVSRDKVHHYCRELGLDKFLFEKEELRGKQGTRYGDMFEALLGALFVDGGYDVARKFFYSKVIPIWTKEEMDPQVPRCYKMRLQEYLVKNGLPSTVLGTKLRYVQVDADHVNQVFTQGIELFGRKLSVATATSRGAADQAVAERLHSSLQKAKTTCLLIRLAREADDKDSLRNLHAARAAQVEADNSEKACGDTVLLPA